MRFAMTLLLLGGACAPYGDARSDELRAVLTRADDALLRARPKLVAGKFTRMAGTPFDFYRGSVPLFRSDWERGRVSGTQHAWAQLAVRGLGDPHPENFGILVAADGSAALEPNDFDAADRVPALFDLRRLTVGAALAARVAGLDLEARCV